MTRVLSILALVGAACSPSSTPATAPGEGSSDTGPDAPGIYALGEFPQFPDGPLPGSTAEALQAALYAAVEEGTFTGVTAAVIVADHGSWAGAAGSADDIPLTPASSSPTHSAGKTVVAAQVLRLVDDGMLGLDDQASDHLPPELSFFDANGATIRQVLAMRSGIPDLNEFTSEGGFYPGERASTAVNVFRKLPEPCRRKVISVQANTAGAPNPHPFGEVELLTNVLNAVSGMIRYRPALGPRAAEGTRPRRIAPRPARRTLL